MIEAQTYIELNKLLLVKSTHNPSLWMIQSVVMGTKEVHIYIKHINIKLCITQNSCKLTYLREENVYFNKTTLQMAWQDI